MEFKSFIESTLNFGKFKGKDISEIPVPYLNWALDNVSFLSPQQKSEIQQQIQKRRFAPKAPVAQPQSTQQVPQASTVPTAKIWTAATVIAPHDVLKPHDFIIVSRRADGNWEYEAESPEADDPNFHGVLPNASITSIIRTIKKPDGKVFQTSGPNAYEVLKDLTNTEPFKPIEKAENHVLSQEKMSEEQKAIDAKFEKIMSSGHQSHIMISALAGSGKTAILKHLAWKYGKPGQKWLYLVFNTKNKVEAKEKFPIWVEVKTTNGFLGEILKSPENTTKIPPTNRMAEIGDKKDKIPEKTRILVDSPAFSKKLTEYGLPDPSSVAEEAGDL